MAWRSGRLKDGGIADSLVDDVLEARLQGRIDGGVCDFDYGSPLPHSVFFLLSSVLVFWELCLWVVTLWLNEPFWVFNFDTFFFSWKLTKTISFWDVIPAKKTKPSNCWNRVGSPGSAIFWRFERFSPGFWQNVFWSYTRTGWLAGSWFNRSDQPVRSDPIFRTMLESHITLKEMSKPMHTSTNWNHCNFTVFVIY